MSLVLPINQLTKEYDFQVDSMLIADIISLKEWDFVNDQEVVLYFASFLLVTHKDEFNRLDRTFFFSPFLQSCISRFIPLLSVKFTMSWYNLSART